MNENREQTLADIEQAYETAKTQWRISKDRLEANKAHYHMQLVARRESGETLRVSDIRAMEKAAIDDVPEIRAAYLDLNDKTIALGKSKVARDQATRDYWDNKEIRR